jgi:hypothetical protein
MSDPPQTAELHVTQGEASVRQRVAELADFYRRLLAYAVGMPVIVGVNVLVVQDSGWWWPWPAFIWGGFLLIRAVRVFVLRGWLSAQWQERKVREILDRQKRNNTP